VADFHLEPMLRGVAAGSDAAARARGLDLRVACPAGVYVRTDRVKVERVLTNLVSNAVKFTERGSVRLVAECASGALEVHVIDSGVGLSADQQSRLFEEFYQATNPERDSRKGFGLGLAISRRLARHLGGDIEVASSPTRGSRFSLLLPGVIVPAPAADSAPTAAAASPVPAAAS